MERTLVLGRVTDNGVIGSVEVRLPLTSDPNVLQLAPFFELGTAWNNQEPDPDPATLASLGLGSSRDTCEIVPHLLETIDTQGFHFLTFHDSRLSAKCY